MFRSVLLLIVTCAAISNVAGDDFRVFTVDLLGTPIPDVDVRVQVEGETYPTESNVSDKDGIATIPNLVPDENGRLQIRVNMAGSDDRDILDISFIGRTKNVIWDRKNRFSEGFAVPLWQPGDVKSLADVVITNPTHLLVAVQRGRTPGARSRIIMKSSGDVDGWCSYWVPDLPRVVNPELARALFAELEPGDPIPARFDAAMQQVFDEVDRQNNLARICRSQVAAGLFPNPNQPPAQQPPGTQPPGTQPPGTQPPGTQPPGTQPPPSDPRYPPSDPRYPPDYPRYPPDYPRYPPDDPRYPPDDREPPTFEFPPTGGRGTSRTKVHYYSTPSEHVHNFFRNLHPFSYITR